MIMIPIETDLHRKDALIIVLGADNLEHMKAADPAEIDIRGSGKRLVNPIVLLCYEESSPALNRLVQGGNVDALIKYLQRGWAFRPDKGDHDRGPESIGSHN